MQTVTVAVIKGGTGKTTTAAAIAQAAAANKKKVIAIDLDPQANMTFILSADQNQPGAYQLLHGTPAAQLIQQTAQGIDCIAASPDLATERTTPASAKRLEAALLPLQTVYDICVIDTPPQMGELTFNALQASTDLIIPLEADAMSLQGLYQITDIAHQMQRSNPHLENMGVVITRYDSRQKIKQYMRDVIADKGKETGAPCVGTIRPGVAVQEAQAMQQSLFEYAPQSKPAHDYMQLFYSVYNLSNGIEQGIKNQIKSDMPW